MAKASASSGVFAESRQRFVRGGPRLLPRERCQVLHVGLKRQRTGGFGEDPTRPEKQALGVSGQQLLRGRILPGNLKFRQRLHVDLPVRGGRQQAPSVFAVDRGNGRSAASGTDFVEGRLPFGGPATGFAMQGAQAVPRLVLGIRELLQECLQGGVFLRRRGNEQLPRREPGECRWTVQGKFRTHGGEKLFRGAGTTRGEAADPRAV